MLQPVAHPFGSPALVIEDCLRLFIVVCGIVMIFVYISLSVNAKRRRFTNATAVGLLAQLAAAVFIVGTEVTKIGIPFTALGYWWRLPVGVLAMVFMVKTAIEVGRYPLIFEERDNPFDAGEE